MKSLSQFINESSESVLGPEIIKAYFDDIHDGLKIAIDKTIDQTNNIINTIEDGLGDNTGIVLNKSQIYDSIIEGLLFKYLNNEVSFTYKQGKEDTFDKDFICTKSGFSDKLRNKFSSAVFSIQVKTSKNGSVFTSNNSGIDEPSFFILISYKKSGYNISLDKAWFGYLTPDDWSVSSNNAKLNTKSFVKKSDKTLFEV